MTVSGISGAVQLPVGTTATAVAQVMCGGEAFHEPRALEVETKTTTGSAQRSWVGVDPDGLFRFQLTPGVNRQLTFRYRGCPQGAVEGSIQIDVVPRIVLHITPRHLRNGGTMHWKGRIEGAPYPPEGIPLLAEAWINKRWQLFDEVLAGSDGRFEYAYTFRRTYKPTTYRFRIATPSTGAFDYEYAPAASPTIAVHVSKGR